MQSFKMNEKIYRESQEEEASLPEEELPPFSDGTERSQTIADVQAVRKIVQDNRKKKTA